MKVESIAKIIDDMAIRMEDGAKELRDISRKMRKECDLTYAAEAIRVPESALLNMRSDLLITRTIRILKGDTK